MGRIGIFGGSFDPPHLGHLWIAESAIEALSLDQVIWIPAATSPLKPGGAVATDQQRLRMVRLAIGGADRHTVDDREIRRGQVSYTVDTLSELRAELPDHELFLIIGSDSLASLDRWHRPGDLLDLATLAVVQRGGEPAIDFSILDSLTTSTRIQQTRDAVISMPVIEISSSDLRRRIQTGRSIRFRVPHPVAAMIDHEGLYRTAGDDAVH